MAYTVDGKYYDEKTHVESRPNVLIPRFKPKKLNEDFSLNFKISEEVLGNFSNYCELNNMKKSKVLRSFMMDVVQNDVDVKKFFDLGCNDKNCLGRVHIKIKKELYESFVKKCHEKVFDSASASAVLKGYMICLYSSEEVS